MDTHIIWWGAIALEAVLLFRGAKAATYRTYPFFYAYIGCVLLIEILRFGCHQFSPHSYQAFYWYSEPVTIAASYAVIVEIFRWSLKHNPAVARIAQNILLVVFVLTLGYVALDLLEGGLASTPHAIAELARDLRYAEGALLLILLWLFGRYRISFGLNLLGLTVGYSLLVGLDVMYFAFLFLPGNELSIGLRKLLPITYVITLSIWCATLWSSQLDPVQPTENQIERDYELLVARTLALLAHASTRLVKAIRP